MAPVIRSMATLALQRTPERFTAGAGTDEKFP